jgi:hypothetical protein
MYPSMICGGPPCTSTTACRIDGRCRIAVENAGLSAYERSEAEVGRRLRAAETVVAAAPVGPALERDRTGGRVEADGVASLINLGAHAAPRAIGAGVKVETIAGSARDASAPDRSGAPDPHVATLAARVGIPIAALAAAAEACEAASAAAYGAGAALAAMAADAGPGFLLGIATELRVSLIDGFNRAATNQQTHDRQSPDVSHGQIVPPFWGEEK